MKNILFLLLFPIFTFAQKKDAADELIPYVNISVYNGKNVVGAEISYGLEVLFGAGYTINYENVGIGKKLSLHPSQYPTHIYQSIVQHRTSIYGTVGVKIKNKYILTTQVGYGETTIIKNAYDPTFSLSKNGLYHYNTKVGGGKQMFGASLQYFNSPISPYIGYDTFNGLKLGIGFLF